MFLLRIGEKKRRQKHLGYFIIIIAITIITAFVECTIYFFRILPQSLPYLMEECHCSKSETWLYAVSPCYIVFPNKYLFRRFYSLSALFMILKINDVSSQNASFPSAFHLKMSSSLFTKFYAFSNLLVYSP
jgi:hypothetical protein